MNSPALQLRGVTRQYVTAAGKLPVLRGVDLDLYGGEIVGLIGPSGQVRPFVQYRREFSFPDDWR